jgi:hypothetical protein
LIKAHKHQDEIALHCRHLSIESVSINGMAASHHMRERLSSVAPDHDKDLSSFYVHLQRSLAVHGQGELIITVPDAVKEGHIVCDSEGTVDRATPVATNDVAMEDARQPPAIDGGTTIHPPPLAVDVGSSNPAPPAADVSSPVKKKGADIFSEALLSTALFYLVRIEYATDPNKKSALNYVEDPVSVGGSASYMHSEVTVDGSGTEMTLATGPRTWFPCVDKRFARCRWKLAFTVHANLTAVSSGELVDKFYSDDLSKVTFLYSVNIPTLATDIGVAVGPFVVHEDPHDTLLTAFTLPHKPYKSAGGVIAKEAVDIIKYFESFFSSPFPFDFNDSGIDPSRKRKKGSRGMQSRYTSKQVSMKYLFVDSPVCKITNFAGFSIVDQEVLLIDLFPENARELTRVLCYTIAAQWFGKLISPSNLEDLWIVEGIVGFCYNLYLKQLEGEATWQLRLLELLEGAINLERQNNVYPLSPSHYCVWIANNSNFSKLVEYKAPYVMNMLCERVGFDVFRRVLQSMIREAMIECSKESSPLWVTTREEKLMSCCKESVEGLIDGADPPRNLSSESFVLLLYSKSDVPDPVTTAMEFAAQFIQGIGAAEIVAGTFYNREKTKNSLTVVIEQELAPGGRLFVGDMKVQVTEEEGDNLKNINLTADLIDEEFPCRTRVRKAKTTKAQKEEIKVEGRITRQVNDTPVRWCRVDPNMEWYRTVIVRQHDTYLKEQLQFCDDVTGKVDALRALSEIPYPHKDLVLTSVNKIFEILENRYEAMGVRCEAAMALAMWQNKHAPVSATRVTSEGESWRGLHLLITCFKEKFYDDKGLLRPNDFSNSKDYELKLALITAISKIRCRTGLTPYESVEFVLNLLRDNDNSGNEYHDGSYLAAVMRCMRLMVIEYVDVVVNDSNKEQEMYAQLKHQIVKQLKRYIDFESIVGGASRVVTVAALEMLSLYDEPFSGGKTEQYSDTSITPINYHALAAKGQPLKVRVAALKAIAALFLHNAPQSYSAEQEESWICVFKWFMDLFFSDQTLAIRIGIFEALLAVPQVTELTVRYSSTCTALHPSKTCQDIFDPLWGTGSEVRAEVMRLWEILNQHSSYDAQLRRLVYRYIFLVTSGSLYCPHILSLQFFLFINCFYYHAPCRFVMTVWGTATPPCLDCFTIKKSFGWTGDITINNMWEGKCCVILREEGVPSVTDFLLKYKDLYNPPCEYSAKVPVRKREDKHRTYFRVGAGADLKDIQWVPRPPTGDDPSPHTSHSTFDPSLIPPPWYSHTRETNDSYWNFFFMIARRSGKKVNKMKMKLFGGGNLILKPAQEQAARGTNAVSSAPPPPPPPPPVQGAAPPPPPVPASTAAAPLETLESLM